MKNTDYRWFNAKNVSKKKTVEVAEFDSNLNADNMRKLLKYAYFYNNLDEFRVKRVRSVNYSFGDQYCDMVENPMREGEFMREDDAIMMQGKVPIANNMIRGQVKTVIGQFRSSQTEPTCVSRDRDEAKLGEMMSIAVQYAYQTNKLWELDARTMEEFLHSGVAAQKIRYSWSHTRQMMDAHVDQVNPMRLFFNGDIEDVRGGDFTCIGEILDMSLKDVISNFCAGNRKKAIEISKFYNNVTADFVTGQYEALNKKRIDNLSFYLPPDMTMCRVIEAWEKESKERLRVHDYLKGEEFICELEDARIIDQINSERKDDAIAHGVDEEDVLLMEYEWYLDQFWYVRYMTPLGHTLFEYETPFEHKESPYVIKMSLFDGQNYSFVGDLIDLNRGINRLSTLIDFIISSSPKGVLVFPESALGDMNKSEIIEEYSKTGGVIFAKLKAGDQMPYTMSSNASNVGAYELLNLYMQSMTEVSGVHGALQGKQASAGTPSSMYAQQAQNASVNLLDLMETFKSFREDRDSKLMKVIQQYYKTPRYLNIAGSDYSKESKWYDPEKVRESEFDLVIMESASTPAFRTVINNMLLDLFKSQAIGVEELLKAGNFPFGDKLLSLIEEKKKQMEQGKAEPMQVPPELQQQMQQGGNPQAQQLIQQATQAPTQGVIPPQPQVQ